MTFLDWLGEISGYKQKYEGCSVGLKQCLRRKAELAGQLEQAEETIRQLELLVPYPTPPLIDKIATKDSAWVQSQIEEMDLNIARFPLDGNYYLTDQANFLNVVAWDWIDSLDYILNGSVVLI